MHEISESTRYHRFIKGEIRVDGWESDWQKDLKRRSAEDKGKTISAPQPKPEKRAPQPPRYCAVCPARLNHGNKYGFCQIHSSGKKRSTLKLAA